MTLVELHPHQSPISVAPRWPYHSVILSQEMLDRLLACNQALSKHGIELIVTRGYENPSGMHYAIRIILRNTGRAIFSLIYFYRRNAMHCLFGANGHDMPGACVDLAIKAGGNIINFLPLGVFTPLRWLRAKQHKYAEVLATTHAALAGKGFILHPDPIEAAQIHCIIN